MGMCRIESMRFECDRCAQVAEFADTEMAKSRGWLVLPQLEGIRGRVLCPTDTSKLDRFLMGEKTPAGMTFNADEQRRWERSCGG